MKIKGGTTDTPYKLSPPTESTSERISVEAALDPAERPHRLAESKQHMLRNQTKLESQVSFSTANLSRNIGRFRPRCHA